MPIIKPSRHFEGSDLGLDEHVDLDGKDITEVLVDLVGPVIWISANEGFCQCPGSHCHTTRDAQKDCKIYLSPVPTISCFYGSCRVTAEEMNRRLRSVLRNLTGPASPARSSAEEKALIAKIHAREALRRQSASSRHRILKDYQWTYEDMIKSTVDPIPDNPKDHWRELLGYFAPDDITWIGDLYASGKPEHTGHFREREDWMNHTEAPGPFTCPSIFLPETFARTNSRVGRRSYLVVESDELDRDTIGAVFRWLRDAVGLTLRCIVDTAGKSLHAWFRFPSDDQLEDLRIVLPELGCDPKMFTASQPCRLPGAIRGDQYQRLIFANKGGLR